MVDECLDEVNERTLIVLTAAFTDENGSPVTPNVASYRIDDKQRRTVILDDTTISPLSTSAQIRVTGEQNRILRPRAPYEIRTVTVHYEWGVDGEANDQFRYKLINLYGVNPFGSPSTSPSGSASPST